MWLLELLTAILDAILGARKSRNRTPPPVANAANDAAELAKAEAEAEECRDLLAWIGNLQHRLQGPDLKSFAALAFDGAAMFGIFKDGQALLPAPYFQIAYVTGSLSCIAIFASIFSQMPKAKVKTVDDIRKRRTRSLKSLHDEVILLEGIWRRKHYAFNASLVFATAMIVDSCIAILVR